MRRQQEIWLKEHTDGATLPTMANSEPASAVVLFTDWLKLHHIPAIGTAVDIGSGKGRNTVHLAKAGYETWALEYIEPALETAKQLAKDNSVDTNSHFELMDIDKHWKFSDNFFDIAVDSFSSIDIETKQGREICRNEMLRTLKSGGYASVTVCSADDEWEKELIANHPGAEPNSTLWPQNGKFQKDYTEAELRDFYQDFEIVEFQTITKPAFKLGRKGLATNFWVILRKK